MAIAGANGTFSLVARDRYNNTLFGGLPSSFSFAGSITPTEGGPSVGSLEIATDASSNGTYSGVYTVTASGSYNLNLNLTPVNQSIAGSPFEITILASTIPSPYCYQLTP